MLPPETTATILPAPARPLSAAAIGAAGGAFGDDVRALGHQLHRARDLVERHDDRAGEPCEQRPHRRQHRLAAGAVDERRRPSVEVDGRPAASDAESGAAVSGSAA